MAMDQGMQDQAAVDALLAALGGGGGGAPMGGGDMGGIDPMMLAALGGGGGMGGDMDMVQNESSPAYLIDRTTEAILNEPNLQAKTQLARILIQLLQYQSGKS